MLRNLNQSASGQRILGVPQVGILAAQILADTATGDYGPGILYNEAQRPEHAGKYLRARVTNWPGTGDLHVEENGSYTASGLPDGVHVFGYDFYLDGISQGSANFTITVGAPSGLTGTAITTSPITLGTPSLAQDHILSGSAISTSHITLGAPALTVVLPTNVILTATGINTSPVAPGTPSLAQNHVLLGAAISTTPTLGTQAIAQIHTLTATAISATPTLGTPALTVVAPSGLTAQGISTQPVTLGTPALTQIAPGMLVAQSIATSPAVLGTPALAQNHALSAGAIAAGPPTFTTPPLSQQHAMVAQWITTGSVVLGRPVLVEGPAAIAVWPLVSDVRLGISYGPTGTEYIGTLVPGSGTSATASEIADAVVAALGGSTGGWPSSTQIADAVWSKVLP